jgi:hypothetical protein
MSTMKTQNKLFLRAAYAVPFEIYIQYYLSTVLYITVQYLNIKDARKYTAL